MSPSRPHDQIRFDPGQRARDHRRNGHPHKRKRKRAGETTSTDDFAITLQKLQVVSYAATQPPQQNRLESVDVLPLPTSEDIGRTLILRGPAGAHDRVFTCVLLSDDTIAWIEISVVLPSPESGGGGGGWTSPTFVQNFNPSTANLYHVAFGNNSRLYLTGSSGVVKSFDAATGTLLQFNGEGAGLCGTTMAQTAPYGIAVDSTHLYIRDQNCMQKWLRGSGTGGSAFGGWVATFGGTTEGPQSGLAIDETSSRLWIADTTNHKMAARSVSTGSLYAAGSGPGSGNGNFNSPRHGILNDDKTLLFVANTGNNRIQVLAHNTAGPTLTYSATIGSAGAGNGQLNAPYQIAIAGDGNLHVVEQGNHRVSVFEPDGTFVGTYGSLGTGIAQLSGPRGIAIDRATGRIAIADRSNNRISMWSL